MDGKRDAVGNAPDVPFQDTCLSANDQKPVLTVCPTARVSEESGQASERDVTRWMGLPIERRVAINSATTATAISSGVSEPMSSPMGAWMASSLSLGIPIPSNSFHISAIFRRLPIMPR